MVKRVVDMIREVLYILQVILSVFLRLEFLVWIWIRGRFFLVFIGIDILYFVWRNFGVISFIFVMLTIIVVNFMLLLLLVAVIVIDVNDVVLEFFYIEYKVFVLMNVGKGRFFIQVQVRDFDFGEVGRVIYNIYDVFLIILVIFFIIDLIFGIVSVKVDLSEKGK